MSISHSSQVPKLAGGLITLDMITDTKGGKQTAGVDTTFRRTKIICTIGPACWQVDQLETLIDAGMNVARFNFSHGDHDGHFAVLQRVRQAAENKQRNVAILLDTKGPEIRTGFFANGVDKINLEKGKEIILTTDYNFKGDAKKLACSYPQLASSVKRGQQILVADGSLVLTVLSCDIASGEINCRIENNAGIGERKNMNLPGVIVDLPTLTEKDIDDIVNWGIKHQVDFIAASFVRKGSDVIYLRKILADNGGQAIKVICKIENQEGLQNYGDILQQTDGIMVARGDLGMEIPPSKVFLAQKMMIREANIAGKPVITATQMLESMIQNPRPTRAECSDVANAVLDGTDCVMLSGETANGPYYEQAVRVMAKTCVEAENARNYEAMYVAIRGSILAKFSQLSTGQSLAHSAVKTSVDVNAKLIVVLSDSGTTARYVAKFRPKPMVVCLTTSPHVARQSAGMLMGVHAYIVDSLDGEEKEYEMVREVGIEACSVGMAEPGDLMVVVSGLGPGRTNQVRVDPIAAPPTPTKTIRHLNSFHKYEDKEEEAK